MCRLGGYFFFFWLSAPTSLREISIKMTNISPKDCVLVESLRKGGLFGKGQIQFHQCLTSRP